MKIDIAYVGADMVLNVLGVENADGTEQTDAAVAVTAVVDAASDKDVPGDSFPIGGTHTEGGNYAIPLSGDLKLVAGRQYQAVGTITLAAGPVLPFRHNFEAVVFETPA